MNPTDIDYSTTPQPTDANEPSQPPTPIYPHNHNHHHTIAHSRRRKKKEKEEATK